MGIINDKYKDEIPEPASDDAKEVFSFFGLASLWAQILERGYQNLAVGGSLSNIESLTKSDLDELWSRFEKKTLGHLFNLVKKTITLPEITEHMSYDALEKRNYLTHYFFWDHAENILFPQGRKIMLEELYNMAILFRDTDKAIGESSSSIMNKFGITEDNVREEYDLLLARVKEKEKNSDH